jgi:hypothetical protein
VETGLVFDDNVGKAARAGDRESDAAALLAASAGYRVQLTAASSLSFTASAESLTFGDFEGLSRNSPGASVAFRRKLGLGAAAPWIQAAVASEYQDFRDEKREGWLHEVRVRFGRRGEGRWSYWVEGSAGRREGNDEAFKHQAAGLGARAEAALTERILAYGGYAVRRGDVTSSGASSPYVRRIAEARTRDSALGPNVYAYRTDAWAHAVRLGLNAALGRRASVDVGYERLIALAEGGLDYRTHAVRGSFLLRF